MSDEETGVTGEGGESGFFSEADAVAVDAVADSVLDDAVNDVPVVADNVAVNDVPVVADNVAVSDVPVVADNVAGLSVAQRRAEAAASSEDAAEAVPRRRNPAVRVHPRTVKTAKGELVPMDSESTE